MNLIPIRAIQEGDICFSKTNKYPVEIKSQSRYGHNCTIPMVTYAMLCDTKDAKTGQLFTLEESLFLSKFFECSDSVYGAEDFLAIPAALANFKTEIKAPVLAYLSESLETYSLQLAGKLPINPDQVIYIARETRTAPAKWCSLETFLKLGRGHTLPEYRLQRAGVQNLWPR